MIVVTNRIAVASGYEEEFEDRFRKRAGLIDSEPGFINNRVERPVLKRFDHASGGWTETSEQQYYLVQTTWRNEEDFWNWTRSASFREAHSNRPPKEMFAAPNVLEIHEIVLDTDSRSE
ncbi:MAG TPA: antibiotic biosynthesis monooxygenase [Deltaproteobacteria bacterium]|nr:antibiotic biosynthesis monooxygenase [Candidatus Binatota bacterium]HIL12062.1 antibiotic biosynthesis monooxygenase [Deltaproteobacteria bacterium]